MYLSSVTGLGIKTTDDSESMENLHSILTAIVPCRRAVPPQSHESNPSGRLDRIKGWTKTTTIK